ncbi:asparaginase, partial [Roseateles sp.]|uniref:asparaginase n=1 Tax=Roseateles sp. TaxID=1971397 RepID=UPI0037CAB161
LGEHVFCKVGAEGVYCAALPERGWGVAIKIDDGAVRGVEVVMAAVIEALLGLDEVQAALIGGYARPVLQNWRGTEVGSLRPAPALLQALSGFRPA